MSTKSTAALIAALALCSCDGRLELVDVNGTFPPDPSTSSPDSNNPTPDDAPIAARASLHRLNRLEYNNSVRDLLGTTLTPADDFPPDASVGGFDNVAGALSITPALMDRYLDAARLVVEDSFADRPEFSLRLEEDSPQLTYSIDRDANRIGGIVRLRGGGALGTINVPSSGAHTLVVRAQGYINGTAAAPRMRVAVAGQEFDFDVPLTMQSTTFAIDLQPGEHPVGIAALNFEEDAPANTGNDIMFDFLEVRTDATVQGPARTRVMLCEPTGPDDVACATTVVQTFARRAWRRPLTSDEQSKLATLVTSIHDAGESLEATIKLGLRAVLSSPKFLYRYRTVEDANAAELLDPFVLASRLSYFIWSSTPDERLMAAAEDGTLSSAEGVRQTVGWMLEDPRSSALADGFAEQWLDLRHLEQAAPSTEVYPQWDEALREAMVRESKLFFLDYLDSGRELSTMLAPDFAYRDARLAAHYGVDAPAGDGFERTAVAQGDRRGVLALSAWLTSRSDTEHSSPIRRGAWLADNMLCAPVPPPPPGLEIGELAGAESGMTLREQLEAHRSDPNCASCHARLDVLGMGFEVYDGIGRNIDDPALDSRGELPTGGEFRGADELAAKLDQQTFVSCVSKKLMQYALGRAPTVHDLDGAPEVATPAITLTLPDLITAIALSPAFSAPQPLETP